MMTFLIGFLSTAILGVMFLLGVWLFEVPSYAVAEWAVIAVVSSTIVLQWNDFLDKLLRKEKRDLVNLQYIGGMTLVHLAVGALLYWTGSDTTGQFIWRLALMFLIGGASVLWMGSVYKKSVTSEEDLDDERVERFRVKEEKKWKKWREKIKKASEEDAFKYLATHLRFALVGDSLSGDLDYSRPLAVVGDETLTYNELVERGVSDSLTAQVKNYLTSLV